MKIPSTTAIWASSIGVLAYFLIVSFAFPHDVFAFIVALMIGRVLIMIPIILGTIRLISDLTAVYSEMSPSERATAHKYGRGSSVL